MGQNIEEYTAILTTAIPTSRIFICKRDMHFYTLGLVKLAAYLAQRIMTGRTFPGLRHDVQLIGDLLRSKASAVCQSTWPTQPFIPLGSINE